MAFLQLTSSAGDAPSDNILFVCYNSRIYERALDIVFRYANNITFNLTNHTDSVNALTRLKNGNDREIW